MTRLLCRLVGHNEVVDSLQHFLDMPLIPTSEDLRYGDRPVHGIETTHCVRCGEIFTHNRRVIMG